MAESERHQFFRGIWVTSLGTLASRVLGLVRDMATAALLGLSAGGAMDAFVVAFRIPNLFRRLFGEGALAASYLPMLSARLVGDRNSAWQLASVMLFWLAVLLTALVLAGEALLALLWHFYGGSPDATLLLGLTATMLPYVIFICLAAQLTATLHAIARFSAAALAPALLNVCWLIAAWMIAPRFAPDQRAQAYVLSAAVVVAGIVQWGVLIAVLLHSGFRFRYDWAASRDAVWRIARATLPMALGLAITQINTLLDSLIAWGLAGNVAGETIGWWGGAIEYPLTRGAAAAIYYGERFYQFPVGVLGLGVATVIFPLLSRHAARGDHGAISGDLTLGLRLVLYFALPATAGLVLLAEPIARLMLERGEFTAADSRRAAGVIACYGAGAWAYCGLPVVIRGFYAIGDRITPVCVGALLVAVNLGLNLALIWPFAEAGLALSTAISAALQLCLLLALFSRGGVRLDWTRLLRTAFRGVAATALMAVAVGVTLGAIPDTTRPLHLGGRVVLPVLAGAAVFLAFTWLFSADELKLLVRPRDSDKF
jgi:putative peptidoglycan lipid II flippase